MSKEFIFPDVGEGIHEGKIVKWHTKEGDQVKADATIVEVETDKAIVELPSPATGIVLKINFNEGQVVKVGEVLVVIGSPGEIVPASKPSPSSLATTSKPVQQLPQIPLQPAATPVEVKPRSADLSSPGQVLASPATRKLARELGVDITRIKGTGSGGRIVAEDLKRAGSSGSGEMIPVSSASSVTISAIASTQQERMPMSVVLTGHEQRVPLTGIRKVVSDRMLYSKTHIPHACGMDFADVTYLFELREREKKAIEAKGIKLTYLPFVIKATSIALKKFTYINANFDEIKGEIVLKGDVNIGIAVDTSDGLMVPVIKGADQKSITQIAQEIERLAALARERKIKVDDMRGGTFTITNIGSVGGFFSTPIINPPEVAIMGVHRIKDMALVVDGKVEARKVMGLSLCFDHRVIDGALATEFMNEMKKYLEDPGLMLLGMI